MLRRARFILLVEDDAASREAMQTLLESWGWSVRAVENGAAAMKAVDSEPPDLVITDLVMPDMSGLDVLRTMHARDAALPVIIVTGQGSVEAAIEATRAGALHFIQKPVDPVLLRANIQAAIEAARARTEVRELRRRAIEANGGGEFIGRSRAMQDVFRMIERVAASKASVVITGESGTGKEMVARALHNASGRSDRPFVAINCSAIPSTLIESEIFGHERGAFTGADQRRLGCFELADGGTLFLDEVGEIPIELQAKFLRVLEEGRVRRIGGKSEVAVDVRVVAATNRDLKERIRAGAFREDLFFRLNVVHIGLPPLRDRSEDIPALVDLFIHRFAREAGKPILGASSAAMRRMSDHRLPGNIRELRNCIERAVLLCDGEWITEAHLPSELSGTGQEASIRLPMGLPLAEVSRAYIEAMLVRLGGNKARTAVALGISEKTLHNKLNRYAAIDRDAHGQASH